MSATPLKIPLLRGRDMEGYWPCLG
jgi:hypothetical protein